MKRYIAVLEIDDDEEIVGDANISYTYRSNGTNYGTDESVELKAEDEEQRMKTYEDGLNEAWEVARKIIDMNPIELGELIGIDTAFESDIINKYSASEAITKIKKYEEKQKQTDDEIKVGDEIERIKGNHDRKYIVTKIIESGYINIIFDDGGVGYVNPIHYRKTGRHFSEIEDVLMQMQKD